MIPIEKHRALNDPYKLYLGRINQKPDHQLMAIRDFTPIIKYALPYPDPHKYPNRFCPGSTTIGITSQLPS